MWQERPSILLGGEIELILGYLSGDPKYRGIVREPLAKSRRGLSTESSQDSPWPLLPLMVCEAINGQYEQALPVAAALQFLICAGDVFDDIEDADCSESMLAKYGSAVATNVATTLIMLAERAITRLKERGVEDNTIIRVIDSINSFYITACSGQHLDLSLGSAEHISEESYLNIICLKSASQIECACHVGALLSTNNQELIYEFSQFGQNLGMATQITNDIQGVITGSDKNENKMSLPVVYALDYERNETSNRLRKISRDLGTQTSDNAFSRELLFSTGAMHYATVKMEYYKQRASDILSNLKMAGVNVERLGVFME
jgi:geranylgeranyl pyrophosphate synthase